MGQNKNVSIDFRYNNEDPENKATTSNYKVAWPDIPSFPGNKGTVHPDSIFSKSTASPSLRTKIPKEIYE